MCCEKVTIAKIKASRLEEETFKEVDHRKDELLKLIGEMDGKEKGGPLSTKENFTCSCLYIFSIFFGIF
uniref:Uncharacterized protein n=1 Tax=Nelumbo nucifera TaxID=4432 RepID=A0A822ZRG9_NELNU|nr:TPA_asm: hypothetical protein HUJ06_004169 [Nelumbo nucifera]